MYVKSKKTVTVQVEKIVESEVDIGDIKELVYGKANYRDDRTLNPKNSFSSSKAIGYEGRGVHVFDDDGFCAGIVVFYPGANTDLSILNEKGE